MIIIYNMKCYLPEYIVPFFTSKYHLQNLLQNIFMHMQCHLVIFLESTTVNIIYWYIAYEFYKETAMKCFQTIIVSWDVTAYSLLNR